MTCKPLPQNGHDCLYSAISILRIATGYKTTFPRRMAKPEITTIDWICDNANKLFPKHEVQVFRSSRYFQSSVDFVPKDILISGKYLFMFDYYTTSRVCLNLVNKSTYGLFHTHTVIGLPDLHEGMYGFYVIAIRVK